MPNENSPKHKKSLRQTIPKLFRFDQRMKEWGAGVQPNISAMEAGGINQSTSFDNVLDKSSVWKAASV